MGTNRKLKHPVLVSIISIVSLGVIHLLRTEQSLSSVMYSFQLFGTLIHEIGHSVAALVTGGRVDGFVVNASTGGFALIAGGNPFIVLPAGYVGSAIFGSLFFYLANRYRWADFFAFLIGLFILLFTLGYGRPEDKCWLRQRHQCLFYLPRHHCLSRLLQRRTYF